MTTTQLIRRFIEENFVGVEGARLLDTTSLIVEGVVDSTGMLEMIAFLEAEFGIRITDAETVPENLETIEQIAQFVERKCASAVAA